MAAQCDEEEFTVLHKSRDRKGRRTLVASTVGGEELGFRAGERAEAEGTKVLRVEGYNADEKSWRC